MIKYNVSLNVLAILLVGAVAGFFVGKSYYEIDLPDIKPPEINIIKTDYEIPRFVADAALQEIALGRAYLELPGIDTIYIDDTTSILTASMDSTFVFGSEINFEDTTISTIDTIGLAIKYYYTPLNKFSVDIKPKIQHLFYSKEVPVLFEKPRHWLDKINVGIGASYFLFLEQDVIKVKPGIGIGIYYELF